MSVIRFSKGQTCILPVNQKVENDVCICPLSMVIIGNHREETVSTKKERSHSLLKVAQKKK
jgi:hypothetical protein